MATASIDKQIVLPTFDRLGIINPPADIDVSKVLAKYAPPFLDALATNNVNAVIPLIVEFGIWRDMLALTWNFRTICGHDGIRKLLNARLEQSKITKIRLSDNPSKAASLMKPSPDMLMIQAFFDFETSAGLCSGIFRLVPTSNGEWKIHAVYTNLDQLHGVPSKTGLSRDWTLENGGWGERRAKELAFENEDPKVIVIGGGHAGLEVAARLKHDQGISSLVIEKNPRIGDNWRDRYDTLCLHDPVWFVRMPFMNFPSSWPVFAAAKKFADWLESYAKALDLNIWTSSRVTSVERDDAKNEWVVTVLKPDGLKRIFRPKYVVLATGFLGGIPHMPTIPGMDVFKGPVMHSAEYKRAADYEGKKIAVIGACTSAHDISQDFASRGFDVTMIQRSSTCVVSAVNAMPVLAGALYSENGPPTEICDLIGASFPVYLKKRNHERGMVLISNVLDKELREGLDKAGFKYNNGPDNAGFITMAWEKGSGYYIDVGACKYIIEGKIKIKNGSVSEIVEDGLVFEDGSSLKADVIVCATGFGKKTRDMARTIFSEALVDKMKPIWGLTREGEMQGLYTEVGLPNVYVVMGNLAQCRFHSSHIALQIKAKEEGLYSTIYEA